MPVPSSLNDLSTTPSLNSPAGSESPALVDDYLRTHAAFIKQVNDESVKTTGDQSIAGTKTFSSPIAGSTTTQVSMTGDQTVAGTKTFSSAPVVPANSFPLSAVEQVATGTVLGRSTAGTGNVEALTALPAVNGSALTNLNGANISSGNIPAERITNALNASGSAPIYACRAWVNFNGTGTVAIRASGNVSSITDNNTGDYTVNFTTAMVDGNFAITGFAGSSVAGNVPFISMENNSPTPSASSARLRTRNYISSTWVDTDFVSVAIFR